MKRLLPVLLSSPPFTDTPAASPERASRPLALVVLGDSLAAGAGAERPGEGFLARIATRIGASRPGTTVFDAAFGSATLDDVVRLQLPRLRGVAADVIVIEAGANDVLRRTDPVAFGNLYLHLLRTLATTYRRAGIVALGLPDLARAPALSTFSPSAIRTATRVLDGRVRNAARQTRARFVDLFAASETLAREDGAFSADGFHPSSRGHALLAAALAPAIDAALENKA